MREVLCVSTSECYLIDMRGMGWPGGLDSWIKLVSTSCAESCIEVTSQHSKVVRQWLGFGQPLCIILFAVVVPIW